MTPEDRFALLMLRIFLGTPATFLFAIFTQLTLRRLRRIWRNL